MSSLHIPANQNRCALRRCSGDAVSNHACARLRMHLPTPSFSSVSVALIYDIWQDKLSRLEAQFGSMLTSHYRLPLFTLMKGCLNLSRVLSEAMDIVSARCNPPSAGHLTHPVSMFRQISPVFGKLGCTLLKPTSTFRLFR
jgi:hypothetical protein